MYRIKAPKGPHGYWVPILANPDIVENYSENIVDSLHKKNLLLLGEDRYLTTLMLKTFPKRKMLFVPQAVCKTIVPDEFRVLLSQRRRWINSTVHNLLELVLVRDLCGTFCFSMQFVIFMELVGTVVLPAAISFTIYLIVISFFTTPVPIIPLALLAAILGLPAILILMTSRKLVYVGWMLVYLISLPIWNFVLPVYAYWHFDDFSWGETRKVEGEGGGHGDKEGEFDPSMIVMKRWCEFERDKQARKRRAMTSPSSFNGLTDPYPYPPVPGSGVGPGMNNGSDAGSAHASLNGGEFGYSAPTPPPFPGGSLLMGGGSPRPSSLYMSGSGAVVPSPAASIHGVATSSSNSHEEIPGGTGGGGGGTGSFGSGGAAGGGGYKRSQLGR